jgi:hypothetical protein
MVSLKCRTEREKKVGGGEEGRRERGRKREGGREDE